MADDPKKELFTPDVAKEMLQHLYAKQRVVTWSTVDKYARDMKEGRWREELAEPIYVTAKGELLNGQHRMLAIIEADTAIWMYVQRNVDEEAFDYIDVGKSRTAANMLRGVEYGGDKAALAKCVLCLEHGSSIAGAMHGYYPNSEMTLTGNHTKAMSAPTRTEVTEYVREHDAELLLPALYGRRVHRAISRGSRKAYGFACYLILANGGDPEPFVADIEAVTSAEFSAQTSNAARLTVRTIQKRYMASSAPSADYLCGAILMGWESYVGLRHTEKLMRHPENVLVTRNEFYTACFVSE